jgi:DNA-binding YbaB/EbfC family protein
MKARIPKGVTGAPQNMNAMLKQAQKIQNEVTAVQEDIDKREFVASAGGGAVEIVMYGKKNIKSLSIKPEAVDPEDVAMLEDLVISAFNECMQNIDKVSEEEITKITGTASIPGLF